MVQLRINTNKSAESTTKISNCGTANLTKSNLLDKATSKNKNLILDREQLSRWKLKLPNTTVTFVDVINCKKVSETIAASDNNE